MLAKLNELAVFGNSGNYQDTIHKFLIYLILMMGRVNLLSKQIH